MRINKRLLVSCIALPLLVGGAAALLTRESMQVFEMVNIPPLSPPAWLFPVAWTLLYSLMGLATYFMLTATAENQEKKQALSVYIYQLVVNFLWPTFFFNLQWYLFSFLWLLLLWVLVLVTLLRYYNISKIAGYLLVPYLVWLTFAAYLNLGIWLLN